MTAPRRQRDRAATEPTPRIALAERIRAACIDAALQAYEDGGVRGLCGDGRWEYAVAAMKRLDLAPLLGSDRGDDEAAPGSSC